MREDEEDGGEGTVRFVAEHVGDDEEALDARLCQLDHLGRDVAADDREPCLGEHVCDGHAGAATHIENM